MAREYRFHNLIYIQTAVILALISGVFKIILVYFDNGIIIQTYCFVEKEEFTTEEKEEVKRLLIEILKMQGIEMQEKLKEKEDSKDKNKEKKKEEKKQKNHLIDSPSKA